MSIPEIKARRYLELALLDVIDSGHYSAELFEKKLAERTRNLTGPALLLFKQQARRLFSIFNHNRMLNEIEEDLDVLYEELFDQAQSSLRYLDKGDLYLRRCMNEAKRVNDQLEYELLTIDATNGYYFGAYDTFTDVAKIDLNNTTAGIDLGTESVRLPRNLGEGKRLMLSHLMGAINAPISSSDPAFISADTIQGAIFGNCFDDLASSWQVQVLTSSSSGTSIDVTFPLKADKSLVEFTSIYLDPLTRGTINITASYSEDGLNYTILPTPRPTVMNSVRLRIGGTKQLAKYVRITFSKTIPERTDGENSVYLFGLRGIELYAEAFQHEAVLTSKDLFAESEEITNISKLSISVDEELQAGTTIDYFLLPSGQTEWIPIAPINAPRDDLQLVVDLSKVTTIPATSNLIVASGNTFHTFPDGSTRRNGIKFYELATLSGTPLFGSIDIRRGLESWRILSKEGVPETKTEADNFILFTTNDSAQQLYVNVDDEMIADNFVYNSGRSTKLRTKFPVLSEPSFRPYAIDGTHTQRPDYLIGKLIYLPGGTESEIASQRIDQKLYFSSAGSPTPRIAAGNNTSLSIGTKVIEFTGGSLSDQHPVRRFKGQNIRVRGTMGGVDVNSVFKILDVRDFPVNTMTQLIVDDPNDLLKEHTGTLICAFQSLDITEDIILVEDDGVNIDSSMKLYNGDRFIIDYRRGLTSDDSVVLDSILVKNKVDGETIYVEGKDYSYDSITKTVYRDPAGQIQLTGGSISVRATFTYSTKKRGLYTYCSYFTVGGVDQVDISLTTLSLAEGERASIYTDAGKQDLTSISKLSLAPGTYKVEVVSKPHISEYGSLNTSSAIYNVINLTDQVNEAIFSLGKYFSQQTAFIESMREVSFQSLVNSVRKSDHQYFALYNSVVVLNFDPRLGEDILCLPVGSASIDLEETFAIGYSIASASTPVESVKFKAVLRRLPYSTPDVTPTLFSYHVRMAHV